MTERTETCQNCRWWKPSHKIDVTHLGDPRPRYIPGDTPQTSTPTSGECRRHPPSVYGDIVNTAKWDEPSQLSTQPVTAWPETKPSDNCGEFSMSMTAMQDLRREFYLKHAGVKQ